MSPTVSIVDVIGGNNSVDFAQTLAVYNRSATIQYHDPLKSCSRTLSYPSWLEQTVPNPYLRTILDGRREVYQADAVSRLPDI